MRRRTLRYLVTPLAVLVMSACGTSDDQNAPPDSSTEESGVPIEARLVLLANDAGSHGAPPALLDDPASVLAYPGWFAGEPTAYDEVRDALVRRDDYPNPARPLLAFTHGPNCLTAEGAGLIAEGRRVDAVFHGQDHDGCDAPQTQIAIFEVDAADLPERFTLPGPGKPKTSGHAAVGPGGLLAFEELDAPAGFEAPPGHEVTEPADMERFVSAMPSDREALRRSTDRLGPRQRAFGFVVTGCALTRAELVLTPSRIGATAVGGENVRCVRAAYYAAVLAVGAERVAGGARPLG
ncbi:MAG: hypothetical protein GEU93_00490 [Propionibacteriales bacterium]|nr:hypothetical protein [Propionibacteriales bacterium]